MREDENGRAAARQLAEFVGGAEEHVLLASDLDDFSFGRWLRSERLLVDVDRFWERGLSDVLNVLGDSDVLGARELAQEVLLATSGDDEPLTGAAILIATRLSEALGSHLLHDAGGALSNVNRSAEFPEPVASIYVYSHACMSRPDRFKFGATLPHVESLIFSKARTSKHPTFGPANLDWTLDSSRHRRVGRLTWLIKTDSPSYVRSKDLSAPGELCAAGDFNIGIEWPGEFTHEEAEQAGERVTKMLARFSDRMCSLDSPECAFDMFLGHVGRDVGEHHYWATVSWATTKFRAKPLGEAVPCEAGAYDADSVPSLWHMWKGSPLTSLEATSVLSLSWQEARNEALVSALLGWVS